MRNYSITLKPDINHGAATGTALAANGDLIFDWIPFEIPKGTTRLQDYGMVVAGTNGADGNAKDMHLYFATALNGIAPVSLGVEHAALTAATAIRSKNNIIGSCFLDQNNMVDHGHLVGYNVWSILNSASNMNEASGITLTGAQNYPGTTQGYQTMWVAGVAGSVNGAWDFGTDVASNEDGSANVAADMTGARITLVTSGTDPRNCFQPGDIVVGSTGGPTMEVVSVDSATGMTVKNISEQLDNAETLVPLNPLKIQLGFVY
jgi:hypothetical protein